MPHTNDIDVIYDSRNFTILKHDSNIYCYSYQNVVSYYDGKNIHSRNELTQTNKKHIGLFKNYIESGVKPNEKNG